MAGSCSSSRPLRVLSLRTSNWDERIATWRRGEGGDPFLFTRALATHGVELRELDPNRFPMNPFAGRSPLLDGIDPLRAIRTLLRERQVDVLLCSCEGPAWLPLLLRRAFRYRPPIVVTNIILDAGWRFRTRILDVVVPQADAVILLAEEQRRYVTEHWGRREGVDVILQSINTEFWQATPQRPDGPILSIGNDHSRDFQLLLRAWPEVDADLILKTKRIPPSQALSPRVTLMPEHISGLALRELYEQSRFVVIPLIPSLNAGGVNSIMEAAAAGRASIISDNPAIRDYVRHEETCLVVPCGDEEAMRHAIQRLVAEPETCARLGENARRMAERISADSPRQLAEALRRVSA
jgi:glycosyltransferase involved in cell wall biosynthesis